MGISVIKLCYGYVKKGVSLFMRSKFLSILFLTLLIPLALVACSNIKDSLSEEKAKQLVIEKHMNNNGTPSILSIEAKNNAYYVRWKNKDNKNREPIK